MIHALPDRVAGSQTKATPQRLVLDVRRLHLLRPRFWDFEASGDRIIRSCQVNLLNVLLQEVFARKGAIANALVQTAFYIVLLEVTKVVDGVGAEDALLSWRAVTTEHTNPLDIAIAVHAGFMSFPTIHIFERLAADSAMIWTFSFDSIVTRCLRGRTGGLAECVIEPIEMLPSSFAFWNEWWRVFGRRPCKTLILYSVWAEGRR
jgi:hypothetical protein